ncbi:hypothetical protein ABIA32_006641 [Streptacidiphilus sp. MAP12-20]|uniref:JmjC domain-containing protein n=1 Tax=Streptacidiphilus sp. MAP12-20 TaxID=3156299 RepID=UPI003516A5DE
MHDAASWAARLGGDTFLAQTYNRSYAHIPGTAADAAALLSWDDLNGILDTQRLEPPRLRLSMDGEMLPLHRYTLPVTTRRAVTWHRVQPAELHARLAEGASLVLDSIEKIHPAIGASAEALERFVGTRVQVNAYASWTDREGFGTHWDDHDVVVVQVSGAKRWKLYGATRDVPTFRDVETPDPPQDDPVADLVLNTGDLLYLPRGWWHAVTADQGTASLHLTFGLVSHTGADLLTWVVDQLRARVALRRDIPRFADTTAQMNYIEALRAEIVSELEDPRLVARWAASNDATDFGRASTSLPYVSGVPANPAITVRLTAPRAHLSLDNSMATLAAAGTAWDFSDQAVPMLRALLDGTPHTLGGLANLADLEVKDVAEVVTTLIEGQAAAVVRTAL